MLHKHKEWQQQILTDTHRSVGNENNLAVCTVPYLFPLILCIHSYQFTVSAVSIFNNSKGNFSVFEKLEFIIYLIAQKIQNSV